MSDMLVRFTDGSTSRFELEASYGRNTLVGYATRGDGKRRVVFIDRDIGGFPRPHPDEWIQAVIYKQPHTGMRYIGKGSSR